jgi:uncharacterized protein YbaR (Trm112 family)
MVAEELLALLRCPETRQPLTVAPPELIARLESLRAAGTLRDRAGNPFSSPLESGLVTVDEALFYPIREGIPVMISGEAIDLRAAFT